MIPLSSTDSPAQSADAPATPADPPSSSADSPSSPATPPAPSFREELVRRGAARELGLLLALPVVLVGVFLLPGPVRDGLVLRADDPTLATAFAAHFVHRSGGHLAGNLAIYAGAVGLGYPLAVLGGRRRTYLSVVVAVLLAYPLVLSGLYLAGHDAGVLLGASGLALALVGALPMVLFAYLGARVDGAVSVANAPALFFLGAAAIVGRTALAMPAVRPFVPAAVLLGALYLLPVAGRLRRGTSVRGRQLHRAGYVELPAAAVVVFFLAVVVAVPADPSAGGGAVAELTLHVLAFALGFAGTYLTDRSIRALGPPAAPAPSR